MRACGRGSVPGRVSRTATDTIEIDLHASKGNFMYSDRLTSVLFIAILTTVPTERVMACPNGQSQGLFGWCYPNIPVPHQIIPNDLKCAPWAAHPYYMQVVVAINALPGQLASIGVVDAGSCKAKSGQVSAIIGQSFGSSLQTISDSLMQCACDNATFSPGAPPTATGPLPCLSVGWNTVPAGSSMCSGGIINICTGNPGPQDPRYGGWSYTNVQCN